jgi:hypothetical protein
VLCFEELSEGDVEEVFHSITALWALEEVCFGFGVELTGAAGGGLGRVDLVEDVANRQLLVDKFWDEFLVVEAQFLDCAMVCFPIDRIKGLFTPLIVFLESL